MPKSISHQPFSSLAVRMIIPVMLFLFLHETSAAQTRDPDTDMGILGYKLEGAFESMPGKLKPYGKLQKLNRFKPEQDSIRFADVILSQVRLYFFKGKLHSIVLKTATDADTEKVFGEFKRLYGPGTSQDQFGGVWVWQGKRVLVKYEKNFLTGEGNFTFFSLKVQRDYEIAEYNRQYGNG